MFYRQKPESNGPQVWEFLDSFRSNTFVDIIGYASSFLCEQLIIIFACFRYV